MTKWNDEPTQLDFTDDATGLACAMRRGPSGSWCGYAAVPPDHPLFGKGYSEAVKVPEGYMDRPVKEAVKVPEGYMDRPVKVDEDYGAISLFVASLSAKPDEDIWPLDLAVRCHGGITFADNHCPMAEPDGNWWFGFDCAHAGDFSPTYDREEDAHHVYRDAEYVKASLAKMCGDLASLAALKPLAA